MKIYMCVMYILTFVAQAFTICELIDIKEKSFLEFVLIILLIIVFVHIFGLSILLGMFLF